MAISGNPQHWLCCSLDAWHCCTPPASCCFPARAPHHCTAMASCCGVARVPCGYASAALHWCLARAPCCHPNVALCCHLPPDLHCCLDLDQLQSLLALWIQAAGTPCGPDPAWEEFETPILELLKENWRWAQCLQFLWVLLTSASSMHISPGLSFFTQKIFQL